MREVYEIQTARRAGFPVAAVEAVCRGSGYVVARYFVTWDEVRYAGIREQDWLSPELKLHRFFWQPCACGIRSHDSSKRLQRRAEAAVTTSVILTSFASPKISSRVRLTIVSQSLNDDTQKEGDRVLPVRSSDMAGVKLSNSLLA
jgi:hypothetical protein